VAYQERVATQQQVISLETKLKREKACNLDAENASTGLAVDLGREKVKVLTVDKELDEARKCLEAELSEHGTLCATIEVVYDDFNVA
jgi:hypothetical protein